MNENKAGKLLIVTIILLFSNQAIGFNPFDDPDQTPVDGGLAALILAGGALGYRAYKKHSK